MKKTPLHQWHVDNGANMAEFGSYSMPLWYPQGAKQEHLGVIKSAGLFDTSHMAVVLIKGDDAFRLLQKTFSKDLDRCIGLQKTPLTAGKCVYGLFLRDNGHVIDDAIVYKVEDNLYMIVVNAGMGSSLAEHLSSFAEFQNSELVDLTDQLGKIDIQGPASAKILKRLLQNPDSVFTKMPYFSFKGWFEKSEQEEVLLTDGTPVLLSRTGYTGEFGFEIFMKAGHLQDAWTKLLEIGGQDLTPCGLASRDSLRAGAVLPLSHQDIGEWPFANNPWPFALPWDDAGAFSKDFVGADALTQQSSSYTLPFAGYDPRKITVGESAAVLNKEGREIGTILTCATDMAISRIDDRIVSIATGIDDGRPEDFKPRGLSCGFVKLDCQLKEGERIFLTDGRRKIEVEIRGDIRPDRTARIPLKEMI